MLKGKKIDGVCKDDNFKIWFHYSRENGMISFSFDFLNFGDDVFILPEIHTKENIIHLKSAEEDFELFDSLNIEVRKYLLSELYLK
jgi:hypothetical protein